MKTITTMKALVLFIATFLIFLTSCHHSRTIKGSGNVSSETRSVSDFTSIDVSAAIKVIYTEGSEYKLEVVADDNLIKYIITEVHGSELRIGIQSEKSFKNASKLEVYVTSPALTGVEASGASGFQAMNVVHTGDFRLKLSGASNAWFSTQMTSMNADLSGASNATISGTANSVLLEGSGASEYHTDNLTTGSAIVNFSGASSGAIYVQNALSAKLSGASSLDYYGNPTVNSNTSGASSIHKK